MSCGSRLLAQPWALHESGSKRADGNSRPKSPSGDRSLSKKPDGLADRSPVFLCCLTDYHRHLNGREPWVITQDDAYALTTTVSTALFPYTIVLSQCLLTVVVALLHLQVIGPGHFHPSFVGLHWRAWPGDPSGTCLCHLDAVHFLRRCNDHLGTAVPSLASGWCSLIYATNPPAPGPLLLVLVESPGHVLAVHAPSLLPRIVFHVFILQINIWSAYKTYPQFFSRWMNQKLIKIYHQRIIKYQQRLSGPSSQN